MKHGTTGTVAPDKQSVLCNEHGTGLGVYVIYPVRPSCAHRPARVCARQSPSVRVNTAVLSETADDSEIPLMSDPPTSVYPATDDSETEIKYIILIHLICWSGANSIGENEP